VVYRPAVRHCPEQGSSSLDSPSSAQPVPYHFKNPKKSQNPKIPKKVENQKPKNVSSLGVETFDYCRAIRRPERWKIPPVEQSRLEEIMSQISKIGYESMPIISEPESSPGTENVKDEMGVYELVDAEGEDDEVSEEFQRVIKRCS